MVGGKLVVRLLRAHPAQDRAMLQQSSDARKMFADLYTRHGRGNRPKFAAYFGAGVRFQIEGVEMARPPRHPQDDAGLAAATLAGGAGR